MRKAIGLAAAVGALAVAAPAQAVVQASGTMTRAGGNDIDLVVSNTGDQAFQEITFQPTSEVVHPTRARTPGGTCALLTSGNGFSCEGFSLAPGARRTFTFTTESPYPATAGGFLLASQASPGTGAGGPFAVRPPTAGGGGGTAPRVGKSEFVRAVRGVVKVRVRGKRRFVALRPGRGRLVRDGSEIDVTRGQARITVAADRRGTTSTADVSEGRAIIDQNTARRPTTTLKLSAPLACPRGARTVTAAKRRKKKRKLFVRTNGGRIRTRGNWASGTASGTAWRTLDTCTTTTIQVTEGTVVVRDLSRRVTRRVTAPGRYTARKRSASTPGP
ncbi:MAG TPA: hypothetical protein VGF25_21555 [Thermoleophilaceae bacterium]|jgi:hypothetical protein